MKRLVLIAALCLVPTLACAQTPQTVRVCNGTQPNCPLVGSANPLPVTAIQPTGTTTQAKVTIAVTNTYQQALASSATRKGCTLQYIAVAGTKGYVFFGAAPGDTTTSLQLTNGQTANCQTPGVTLTDAVQVTGTGTDIFVVTNQ